MMAHTYSHLYNISTTGLRFFTVYGPDAILNDRAIKVFNHGNMSRDFTYVADNPATDTQNPYNASIRNENRDKKNFMDIQDVVSTYADTSDFNYKLV